MRLIFLGFVVSVLSFAAPVKVGLVLDKGGKDDKSFNTAAYRGATEAQKQFDIQLKVVESSDDAGLEPSLRTFAQKGFQIIIGIGFVQAEPIKKVAASFPKTHFVLIDAHIDAPNVRSIIFNEHEGAYLVGAIAALFSKSHVVGFVGGMDIPLIRRFQLGYQTGAEKTVPNTKVLTHYVGSSSDAWRNPTKAKELALSQYQQKADVIFAPAGASGLGVFDAAEEKHKYGIGCDSNQNWIKPGKILTSMLKRVDSAVKEAIEMEIKSTFQAGKITKGIAEGGIDYIIDENNRALFTPELEKKANEIREKIRTKEILVPDYYVSKRAR